MTKQILAFLFCFIRELNPYSLSLRVRTQTPFLRPLPPRTLSLWLNRVKESERLLAPASNSTNPILPPYIHP